MRLPSRRWFGHYARMTALMLVPALLITSLILALLRPHAGRPAPSAAAAYRFPDGSRQIFPGQRLVGLYGAAGEPVLGALGEQSPAAATSRARQLAAQYQPLAHEKVMPSLEVIATVASGSATSNHDFSREVLVSKLWPWVKAAQQAGQYVILDLQPGSTAFPTQAKEYAALLREPNVGLALDPEWRLQPGKQHLVDIGSVSIDEVNATARWLAQLTSQNDLPQKLFLIHQFRQSMVTDRAKLDTRHQELAMVIQMDGQGTPEEKKQTYAAITADAPANVRFGWKNFYAKDPALLTPAQTMQEQPQPWYVSYQ